MTLRADSLTCHGLSVEGAGDANGDYHQEPGKHAYGRPVYRQAREPYCTIHVETWGWSVKNNGNTLAFSQYASMCPADPLAGYEGGVVITCIEHQDILSTPSMKYWKWKAILLDPSLKLCESSLKRKWGRFSITKILDF